MPVHPARLHAHRTSPAQPLLTILAGHLPDPQRLTCSRTATVAGLVPGLHLWFRTEGVAARRRGVSVASDSYGRAAV